MSEHSPNRAFPFTQPELPRTPFRAVVTELCDDGRVEVERVGGGCRWRCDCILSAGAATWLRTGAAVLVAPGSTDVESPCILGPVGRWQQAMLGAAAEVDAPPRTKQKVLTLDAEEEITLRCGSGSLTLRADGRVLVRGLDIVTLATRRNRIKGGTVEIN